MTKLYREHEGVRSIFKQLMSLNLIPWQKVLVCWENLVQQGKDSRSLPFSPVLVSGKISFEVRC
jgi:hypothetical protein